ncbi:response regulator [Pantanalinema sp. GBBB05]|uniref:response regulator n=1 Tax=Pantanalinema sp. GBBB05 TaxID=2604139 RepID=UPI001D1DA405|nr:response regulator [Pantanalinema sp. GBBB05]
MRILLVDDDELLTQTLANQLIAQRYAVDVATDGEAGWDYAQAAAYDLIVLDINLPKLDGIRLCQRLRQHNYHKPILLLTAKGDSSDKVVGLDAGADDYVVKPCTIEELCARIRALLRRQNTVGSPVLEWGDLRLDPGTCEVTYHGQLLPLSPKEYGLLELFLRSPQRVFSSSIILEHLWGFDDAPGEETVRTHIKRLRRKLKAAGAEEMIDTVYGMGYRLKPPCEAPSEEAIPESNSSAEQARLAAIATWEQFKPSMLERLAILEQTVIALQHGNCTEEVRQRAEGVAHKLAGSLGMFGFPKGSELGRQIEYWFQSFTGVESLSELESLVTTLQQELQQAPHTSFWDDPAPPPLNLESPRSQAEVGIPNQPTQIPPLLLVVDDDLALTQKLQAEAAKQGLQVEIAIDVDEARIKIAQRMPSVVLLDLKFPDPSDSGLVLLDELASQYPSLPVLVFTVRDEFDDRLAVARRGSHRFISKSTPLPQVLDAVHDTLKQKRLPEIKILAVDDDPMILDSLQQCLPRWGIHPITLNDPRQLWNILETESPDLLILDVDMPHINGIELCRVIRNDTAWSGLPILFLSARRDTQTILNLYTAGADDYVAKPFTEPEVVTRIFNRLERNRLLRSLAETDPLTGVANRHRSTRELNRYLNLVQRYHQPLCLAVIDLDHFKQINDQYGHDVGDIVLKQLAAILQRKFRGEDVVARWGGEEFLVGMYGMKKLQALERLNQVLQMVRQEVFSPDIIQSLQLTFSAGVAEAPENGLDLNSLYRSADAAMYRAKAAGRNQILLA